MLGSKHFKKSFNQIISTRFISDKFQPGDYVIITPLKKTVTKKQWLSRPLKDLPNSNVNLNFGKIPHTDLINQSPFNKVHTFETKKKLAKYICSRPTLEQWINLSSRKAQPIYSFDAQAIVSLVDLHIDYVEPPLNDNDKINPLQFLEAGTGHGSLTLAISKALHPANALAHYAKDLNLRGAILHSIDCNLSHSITGKRTLKGFRRGMYYNNVEFHVSESPSNWIKTNDGQNWLERELINKKLLNLNSENIDSYDPDEPNAFLSGIFLDMPNYHEEMIKLVPYLKTGGFIIVFCPSITQILDAIDLIASENEKLNKLNPPTSLHLEHERTIQLLDGAGGGLKEWDTRRAFIRATGKIGYSVRPKVGVRTVAGGFVAIWRKLGKEVNLELERDLMDNYEGKPDPIEFDENIENNENNDNLEVETKVNEAKIEEKTNDEPKSIKEETTIKPIKTIEQSVDPKPIIREAIIKPAEKNELSLDSKSKLSKAEKAAMFAPDLLSTAPEVFEDAEHKNELIEDNYEDSINENDDENLNSHENVNDDFKVEEATLIPYSVLNTVFHSCHGDPDVHVGYIKNVFLMPTPIPEGMELDDLSHSPSVKETETNDTSNDTSKNPSNESENNEITDDVKESETFETKPKTWTKHTL